MPPRTGQPPLRHELPAQAIATPSRWDRRYADSRLDTTTGRHRLPGQVRGRSRRRSDAIQGQDQRSPRQVGRLPGATHSYRSPIYFVSEPPLGAGWTCVPSGVDTIWMLGLGLASAVGFKPCSSAKGVRGGTGRGRVGLSAAISGSPSLSGLPVTCLVRSPLLVTGCCRETDPLAAELETCRIQIYGFFSAIWSASAVVGWYEEPP